PSVAAWCAGSDSPEPTRCGVLTDDLRAHEARLPESFSAGLRNDDLTQLRRSAELGGFRILKLPGELRIARSSTSSKYLHLEPLQTKRGDFRNDVARLISGLLDPQEAAQ